MDENYQFLMNQVRLFNASRIIITATELEIWEPLASGPITSQLLAKQKDLDARALGILLDALVSLEILERAEEAYRISPGMLPYLDPESSKNILHYIWHISALWTRWSGLTETVCTGRPSRKTQTDNPDWTSHFIGAMEVVSRHRAPLMAQQVNLAGASTLLDLGGGPGIYGMEFAKANAGLKVVVFDLPGVTPLTQNYIARDGMQDRVSTLSGDYLFDNIGGPYDAIWISSIVHMHTEAQNAHLIRKAVEALNPGGRLMVRDFLLNENGDGPVNAAVFAVNMLVSTDGGRSYKASEIAGWLKQAGLRDISVTNWADDGMVCGTKA